MACMLMKFMAAMVEFGDGGATMERARVRTRSHVEFSSQCALCFQPCPQPCALKFYNPNRWYFELWLRKAA
jgi:hypothetical protein